MRRLDPPLMAVGGARGRAGDARCVAPHDQEAITMATDPGADPFAAVTAFHHRGVRWSTTPRGSHVPRAAIPARQGAVRAPARADAREVRPVHRRRPAFAPGRTTTSPRRGAQQPAHLQQQPEQRRGRREVRARLGGSVGRARAKTIFNTKPSGPPATAAAWATTRPGDRPPRQRPASRLPRVTRPRPTGSREATRSRRFRVGCEIGRIRISLTSTCAGWETAYITARAMSSGSSAPVGRLSKNGVSTMPGSIDVTRMPVPCRSWRAASAIAVTACFVAL